MDNDFETIHLGAGCFWNSELVYSKQDGVIETEVGWSSFEIPHQNDGRVEVVKVTYNPNKTSLEKLVEVFWTTHNPKHKRNLEKHFVERSMLLATTNEQEVRLSQVLIEKKKEEPGVFTEVATMKKYQRAPEKDQKYYMKR